MGLVRVLVCWALSAALFACYLYGVHVAYQQYVVEPRQRREHAMELHIARLASWFDRACADDFRERNKWIESCDLASERGAFLAMAAQPLPPIETDAANADVAIALVACMAVTFVVAFVLWVWAVAEWSTHCEEQRTSVRKRR